MADIQRIIELQVKASADSVRRLDEIARSAANVESMATRAGRAFGALSSILMSGAIAGAAIAMTRVATAMDDIGDAAQRAGTSAGFMGWLDRVGRANETDLPELERAMRALNLSLDEAQDSGSGAAAAFRRLGLDSSTLGAEDLPRIAVALQSIEDRAERARIEAELFGKSGYNLSLTLAAIAEKGDGAGSEIAAFSDKMIDAYARAEEFDKNLKALQQTATDLTQGFTAGLLPAINSIADAVSPQGDAYSFAKGFGEMLGNMATNAMKWGSAIGLVYDYLRKPLQPGFIGDFKKDWGALEQGWADEEFRKQYLPGGLNLSGPKLPQAPRGGASGNGKAAKAAKDQFQKLSDWSPLSLRWESDFPWMTQAGDATGPAEEIHKIQEALDRLTGQDKVKELSANLGLLHDALDRGAITAEQYDDAMQRLFADTIPDAAKQTEDAMRSVSTAITDAAGEMADAMLFSEKSIGESLESIAKSFIRTIARIQIEAMLKPLTTALPGLLGGIFGGGSGAVDGSAMFAGWGTGAGIPAFASGDVFSRPTLFGHGGGLGILGEAGPEAVMPLRRGPSGKLGVEGAAPVVNVPVQVVVENKSSAQVGSVRETRGANGMREIRVLIQDAVRAGIVSGEFDSALSSGYGLVRNGRR